MIRSLSSRTLLCAGLLQLAACATVPVTQKVSQAPVAPPSEPAPETPASFAEGVKAFNEGKLDEAREAFEETLEENPASVNAQFNLGVIAEREGNQEAAQKAYESALRMNPQHLQSVLNLGKVYRQQERFDAAIALYENTLKRASERQNLPLLNALTGAYRLAGKLDQAEATAKRVLARAYDNAEAYKNLSLVYYDQKKYRLAELVSANARKLDEKDPGIYNNLGMIYLKLNDRPRAFAQFQKAVSLDPQFLPGQLNMGAMALAFRDYVGAEKAFTRAIALDPNSYEGHLYLAYALDGQKGRDAQKGVQAGEAFEKALTLRKELPAAICGAGWAYAAERKSWDKALSYLDHCKGLSETPQDERARIDSKVKGLLAMKSQGEPKPAAAETQAEEAPEAPVSP